MGQPRRLLLEVRPQRRSWDARLTGEPFGRPLDLLEVDNHMGRELFGRVECEGCWWHIPHSRGNFFHLSSIRTRFLRSTEI